MYSLSIQYIIYAGMPRCGGTQFSPSSRLPARAAAEEYASDNRHPGCPARMADGRLFTDYRPSCSLNGLYPPRAPRSSYDMRQELIGNAGGYLRRMREAVSVRGACTPCTPEATLVPHAAEQACGTRMCGFRPAARGGLGTERTSRGAGLGSTERTPRGAASQPPPHMIHRPTPPTPAPLVDFDLA